MGFQAEKKMGFDAEKKWAGEYIYIYIYIYIYFILKPTCSKVP